MITTLPLVRLLTYSAVNNTYNKHSYAHNLTIEDCTFTDMDGVVNCAAIRNMEGGDKNWTVKGCTVDNTMHSILQASNINGKLVMEDCKVNSKNGANLNSSTNLEMTNCTFDVKGYAVRVGVETFDGNNAEPKTFTLTDCTLKSACNDGDAVIIFRESAVNAKLTLNNTKLEGTKEISDKKPAAENIIVK